MSSAGHVFDAINRAKYNRAIKQMKRARYNELKEAVLKTKSKYHKFVDRNKLSDTELYQYKKKVRSKIKKDKQLIFLKSIIITAVIGLAIIYTTKFFYNLFINSF